MDSAGPWPNLISYLCICMHGSTHFRGALKHDQQFTCCASQKRLSGLLRCSAIVIIPSLDSRQRWFCAEKRSRPACSEFGQDTDDIHGDRSPRKYKCIHRAFSMCFSLVYHVVGTCICPKKSDKVLLARNRGIPYHDHPYSSALSSITIRYDPGRLF
jgi:hypothetical protein